MSSSRIECAIRMKTRQSYPAPRPPGTPPLPTGRVPRVSRLLALAHKLDDLLRQGTIRDYAALARLGHVSRARISQIMNLLDLAADIQEDILLLPPTLRGRDFMTLRQLQPIARTLDWRQQRALWRNLTADKYPRLREEFPGGSWPVEVTDSEAGPAHAPWTPAVLSDASKNSATSASTGKDNTNGQV